MKIYAVEGCAGLGDYDYDQLPPGVEWLAYWYEDGDYCGGGLAAAFRAGRLLMWDMSHCSCYGPSDSFRDAHGIAVADINTDDIHGEYPRWLGSYDDRDKSCEKSRKLDAIIRALVSGQEPSGATVEEYTPKAEED